MSKLKLPKPYISHSQFYLFIRDPMAYYEQYFVGRVDEPTPKMVFGKIFQEAWSDKSYDYEKALQENGFTSDKLRVIKTALAHPETIRLPKSKTEKKITIKHPDIEDYKLLSIMDGLDKEKDIIIENKMGMWWNEIIVEHSSQITWYMMSYYIKYGKMPKLFLQSFNANNGFPRIFKVKRTNLDFKMLIRGINSMITKIESGDFEKY